MSETPVNPLAEIRAAHVLCTHSSIRSGGIKLNKAGCSCGAYYTWNRREAEHGEHVDAVIVGHFAAREAAARREAEDDPKHALMYRALLERAEKAERAVARVEALAARLDERAKYGDSSLNQAALWIRAALAEPERDEEGPCSDVERVDHAADHYAMTGLDNYRCERDEEGDDPDFPSEVARALLDDERLSDEEGGND